MLRGARCVVRSGEAVNEGKILRPVGSKRPIGFAALLCKESRATLAPEKKFSLTREHFLSGEVGDKELCEAENSTF